MSDKLSVLGALSICVCMLVASIPIAMQVVSTSVMAVGAHKLAQKEAIVSRLAAIEELAGMDILCSDKTGTLTKNELSINKDIYWPREAKLQDIVQMALLASKKNLLTLDAIDTCIWKTAKEVGVDLTDYEEVKFLPFDPVIKRTEAILQKGSKFMRVAKGAPQIILAMSSNRLEVCAEVEENVNE